MANSDYVHYASAAGAPGSETLAERERRERYWRTLRVKVDAGASTFDRYLDRHR